MKEREDNLTHEEQAKYEASIIDQYNNGTIKVYKEIESGFEQIGIVKTHSYYNNQRDFTISSEGIGNKTILLKEVYLLRDETNRTFLKVPLDGDLIVSELCPSPVIRELSI